MSDWINFALVISGQFLILLAFAFWRQKNISQLVYIVWRSLLLGLPLGFLYDTLIGQSQAVFYYSGVPDSWIFTAMNGALSYGFAIATASLFPIDLPLRSSGRSRLSGIMLCSVSLAMIFSVTLSFTLPTLAVMFVIGAGLILCSEGLSLWGGYMGPAYCLLHKNIRPTAMLWTASIAIGSCYELLNYWFPLWHWQEARNMPHWQFETLLIVFGYFTLFLPMLVLARIFIRHK